MAEVKVAVTDEQMEKVVAAALLQLFTPEKQAEMVQKAIQDLLHGPSRYDKNKTRLQEILDDEVRRFVRAYCEKLVNEDEEFRAKLKGIVDDGFVCFFADEKKRQQFVEKLGDAIGKEILHGRGY